MRKLCSALLLCALLLGCTACGRGPESDGYTQTGASYAEDTATPDAPLPSDEAPAPSPKVIDFGWQLPAGFTAADEDETLFYAPDYPDDSSTFCVGVSDADPWFAEYTESVLADALAAALRKNTDEPVTVTAEGLEYYTISELSAYRFRALCTVGTQTAEQLYVCVNADQLYTFVWTDTGEADWAEPFAACADSLWFTIEGLHFSNGCAEAKPDD